MLRMCVQFQVDSNSLLDPRLKLGYVKYSRQFTPLSNALYGIAHKYLILW